MSVSYTEYSEDVVNVVERRFAHGNNNKKEAFSVVYCNRINSLLYDSLSNVFTKSRTNTDK